MSVAGCIGIFWLAVLLSLSANADCLRVMLVEVKQKGQVTLLIESLGTVVRAQIPAATIRKTTAQNLENTSKKTKKIEMHI